MKQEVNDEDQNALVPEENKEEMKENKRDIESSN